MQNNNEKTKNLDTDLLRIKKIIYKLKTENRKLKKLLSTSKIIMSDINIDTLLQRIMGIVTKVMDADRSTLFLIDKANNKLWSKVAQGENLKKISLPIGVGIAGYVAKTGDILNIKNAYEDYRFNKEIDKKTGYKTETILCIPIRNTSKNIMGVIEVLNKKEGVFQKSDEKLLNAFCSLAAISIENALNYKKMKQTMKTFELFVPKKFIERIAKEGFENIKLGKAQNEIVSILFSDIRNFTPISEKLSPDNTLAFLNSYLKKMSSCINKYDGFVDKFMGDAIMAIFDNNSAENAVQCAIEMNNELEEFNQFRIREGKVPIEVGVGINTGYTIIGTIGSDDRMDSTVIGDPVNVASRLENLNKIYKTNILISNHTYEMIQNKDLFNIREIDKVTVKGKEQVISIYEVFNNNPENIKHLKMNYITEFYKAISLYREKNWFKALQIFQSLMKRNEEDGVLKIYIERCKKYVYSPPKNWNGTVKLDFK